MDLAGAVGGDDHDRRLRGLDRAELRDGHLEVGQHLEQERLERLVGAVELVDQEHRRRRRHRARAPAAAAAGSGSARRRRRARAARGRARPPPRRRGSRSSARRSSTRRPRWRRRGPRSIAAGSAAGRASATAPWRSRSCRRRPRLRGRAAAPSSAPEEHGRRASGRRRIAPRRAARRWRRSRRAAGGARKPVSCRLDIGLPRRDQTRLAALRRQLAALQSVEATNADGAGRAILKFSPSQRVKLPLQMPGSGITAAKFSKIGKERSRQTAPCDDIDPATRPVKPLLGQFAWNVDGGVGSMLTLEFGTPHIIVRSRGSSPGDQNGFGGIFGAGTSRSGEIGISGYNIATGRFRFPMAPATVKASTGGSRTKCPADLDGQRLIGVGSGSLPNSWKFEFDLGGVLELWPSTEYEAADNLWSLYRWSANPEVLTFRGRCAERRCACVRIAARRPRWPEFGMNPAWMTGRPRRNAKRDTDAANPRPVQAVPRPACLERKGRRREHAHTGVRRAAHHRQGAHRPPRCNVRKSSAASSA